jgi:hypothetical protein
MREVLLHHKGSFIFAIVTMLLGFGYGLWLFGNVPQAVGVVFIMFVLSVLECSLSIDNAVINAKMLGTMDEVWQKRFLTWGMIIAVFGMRIVFPVLIVSVAGGIGMFEALNLAINDQVKYSELLQSSHIVIAGFGGAFLFLVALDYFFNVEKDIHWVGFIERKLSRLGERKSISIVVTLLVMYYFSTILPQAESMSFFISGIFGIISHELVKLVGDLIESNKEESNNLTGTVAKNGLAGFLYLEILDASFSFDGVLGALVISKDIFIIAGGLAVGAMFVRSMTIHLVKAGSLSEYRYLEHGAFYAILTLAIIMFTSTMIHIPEVITGILSVAFIGIALYSSVKWNKNNPEVE